MGGKIEVRTYWNADVIQQEVGLVREDIFEAIGTEVVRIQDEGLRQALIALGWTPPKEKESGDGT